MDRGNGEKTKTTFEPLKNYHTKYPSYEKRLRTGVSTFSSLEE